MRLSFNELQEVARRAREVAVNCSTPNPARAVERTLLVFSATSSGDASPSTGTPGTPAGQSPEMAWQTDCSKGKDHVHSAAKRTREG